MSERPAVAQALRDAAATLAATSDSARLDAELLMAHVLGVTRSEMLVRHISDAAPSRFDALVERRMGHEPVAYIVGEQEFFGLTFTVTPDVLIPRADSETLVERALAARPDARRVLDCGTGSGALLLAVMHHMSGARGVGIDRSAPALRVAQGNAAMLGLAERTQFHLADWTTAGWSDVLGGPFDLILANPPYVETGAQLMPDVRDFEPTGALFAGADGLDAYRILIPQLQQLLSPGGVALIEIGASQADAVDCIARTSGLLTTLFRDMANRARVMQVTAGE